MLLSVYFACFSGAVTLLLLFSGIGVEHIVLTHLCLISYYLFHTSFEYEDLGSGFSGNSDLNCK